MRTQLASELPVSREYRAALEYLNDVEDNLEHPTGQQVCAILQPLGVDDTTLIAAILSDMRLTDKLTLDVINHRFGSQVEVLVRNVRNLTSFKPTLEQKNKTPEQAERLRRFLLSMVDDVRAVLIKLAFRVARLRLIKDFDPQLRKNIAQETLDVFAPLANRLGVAQLKWEMEDFSFRYLEADTYKKIARGLDENRIQREQYLQQFQEGFLHNLKTAGVKAKVYGRPKHIYSIWKKMNSKQLDLSELYDLRALRVIVDDVTACYTVLGVINSNWKTVRREFDDYIAHPKPNGYQSLHTVVIGPEGKHIEVQIRTESMHDFAELGFAAHWRYKEGSAQDTAMEKVIVSLRGILDEGDEDSGLLEHFQAEIFPDKVFVLTPDNDAVELSRGATPLDFAYAIHTEVGHRCRGAKVDGKIVSLTTVLEQGQQVEVLTSKLPGPSRDWMNPQTGYLSSPRARSKVRHYFHKHEHDDNLEAGHRILEQTSKRWKVHIEESELLKHFRKDDLESVYVDIGRGSIRQTQLDAFYRPETPKKPSGDELKEGLSDRKADEQIGRHTVSGVSDLLTRVAKCCKPIPGDDVVGYITLGHGVTVHKQGCPNMTNLPEERQNRLINIDWGKNVETYPVDIEVEAYQRHGLLNDITQLLSSLSINLLRADSHYDDNYQTRMLEITIQIKDSEQLSLILNRLMQVKNVISASRKI